MIVGWRGAAAPPPLRAEDLLDGVARHGVEEEQEHDGHGQDDEHLEDGPLVVVPHDVADGLERVQEPHEGRVRPAATKGFPFSRGFGEDQICGRGGG